MGLVGLESGQVLGWYLILLISIRKVYMART